MAKAEEIIEVSIKRVEISISHTETIWSIVKKHIADFKDDSWMIFDNRILDSAQLLDDSGTELRYELLIDTNGTSIEFTVERMNKEQLFCQGIFAEKEAVIFSTRLPKKLFIVKLNE